MNLKGTSVLVVGANGMLGHDVVAKLIARDARMILASINASNVHQHQVECLDITDQGTVDAFVGRYRPEVIINCAAYTAVDRAEEEPEIAFAVNAVGPNNLARAAAQFDARLVHLSTDYVFGGKYLGRPWCETDECTPCGVYGRSKREGEVAIQKALPTSALIVRTSWLYGFHGPNFVHTILRVAREKEELRVVSDQVGSPTWSSWLAEILLTLIEKEVVGFVHASNRGDISWFDFASEIVRQAGLSTRIVPQTTAEAMRPAPRPSYSTLDVSLLEGILGGPVPLWKDCLKEHLTLLGGVGV